MTVIYFQVKKLLHFFGQCWTKEQVKFSDVIHDPTEQADCEDLKNR